jgi:hypothetical protein
VRLDLALESRGAANVWLGEAKALEDAQPHTLLEEDHVRLELGLESLRGESAPPPP